MLLGLPISRIGAKTKSLRGDVLDVTRITVLLSDCSGAFLESAGFPITSIKERPHSSIGLDDMQRGRVMARRGGHKLKPGDNLLERNFAHVATISSTMRR